MFRILLKDLRISPIRTFLTGFSMFIGIIAMIAAVLVGTLGRESLLSVNAQLFGRTPTYSLNLSGVNFENTEKAEKFFEILDENPEEKTLISTPKTGLQFAAVNNLEDIKENNKQIYQNLMYVDAVYTTPKYNKIYNLPLYKGEWFDSTTANTKLEVVVNKAGLDSFSTPYIVGSCNESLALIPFNVTGVINDGKDWPVIYINTLPLIYRIPSLFHIENASIYWYNKIGLSQEQMQSYINDILYDTIGGKVENIDRVDGGDDYESVIDMLQLGLIFTAALLLFVSVLGQINIGLSSLEQRTHELLIRRALGASRCNISVLVLGSQFLLSLMVCTISIIVSLILVNCIGLFLPSDTPITVPEYPITAAVIAVISSIITALLGGVIPAIKAAKLEPALALR